MRLKLPSLGRSAVTSTPTFVKANCDPATYAAGSFYYNVREASGVLTPYIGDTTATGVTFLPPYDGHRGVEDVTPDGRYVLYVKALCSGRASSVAEPGKGINNVLHVLDQITGADYALMPDTDVCGWTPKRKAVMWADFNRPTEGPPTQVSWTQMVRSGGLAGYWEVRVADLTPDFQMINERKWTPATDSFVEVYGWVPGTNQVIFTSNYGTGGGMLSSQLWTIDAATLADDSRQLVGKPSTWSGSPYHEFANWRNGRLLTNSTYKSGKGGLDLWEMDLDGSNPVRLTYFNGDKGIWGNTIAVPGWPTPTYTNVLGGMGVLDDETILVGIVNDAYANNEIQMWKITP
jgi:hypothetical protein